MIQNNKNKYKYEAIKAITIVETLMTLLAISIMLVGPLTFVSKSFSYAKFIQNKTIATGLSQEGLELVTALRNGVASPTVMAILDSCSTSGSCYVDWNGISGTDLDIKINTCAAEICRLYRQDSSGIITYKHNLPSSEKTDFLRQIIVNKSNLNNSYIIKSRVWSDVGDIPLDIIMQKTLFIF